MYVYRLPGTSGMSPIKRKFRESHKRIVAARQEWRCGSCDNLLSSAFQVDHVIPLWKGGADEISNATASCACCHAKKTQLEAIDRADRAEEARQREAEKARVDFERRVRAEEASKQASVERGGGQNQCTLCRGRFYTMFGHKCRIVERKVSERLNPPKRGPLAGLRKPREPQRPLAPETLDCNPFARFLYSTTVPLSTMPRSTGQVPVSSASST